MWEAKEVAVTEAGSGIGATTGGILDILFRTVVRL